MFCKVQAQTIHKTNTRVRINTQNPILTKAESLAEL